MKSEDKGLNMITSSHSGLSYYSDSEDEEIELLVQHQLFGRRVGSNWTKLPPIDWQDGSRATGVY